MVKKVIEYDYIKEDNDAFLPLRDTVFNQLRLQILHGELKPGERLMEVALAERLGVSRTPVREAIRMLEQEGLAVLLPRRGAHVASINERQLEEMLEVRRTLETFTVNAACSRITLDELNDLKRANEEFAAAVKSGDVIRIAETDIIFHDRIAHYAGNSKIEDILHHLKEQLFRYKYEYLKDTTEYDHLVTEHDMICDAFEHGSNDKAVEVIKLHIDTQELSIYYHLRDEQEIEEKYNRR